ncbi:MAG: hypothetical protein UY48_C0003G0023 [Candidatus Gottesmanbacteria bacterium GW2011_GWB1_49_7]|uniref:Uncharacterized protein n=1 Tax=Candidatus Gottesmanbacteria bacterium GW2011_GWB1_49_7 TaxID=1618448 RepID=A0A0G1W376_9BACT|nr:MAG: hypothetical protein UY48_C0003G0023 [Candidatus Gottesmanbacteria bacterium GW2011_GWB1_49_7]
MDESDVAPGDLDTAVDFKYSAWGRTKDKKKRRGNRTNGYGESGVQRLLHRRSSCLDCVLIETPNHMTIRLCEKHMQVCRMASGR